MSHHVWGGVGGVQAGAPVDMRLILIPGKILRTKYQGPSLQEQQSGRNSMLSLECRSPPAPRLPFLRQPRAAFEGPVGA